MPPSITITIQFDEELQKVTGTAGHSVIMSEAASFVFLLMSVFSEYSGIEGTYPPGTIGFTLNGDRPETYSPLFNGDIVHFYIPKAA